MSAIRDGVAFSAKLFGISGTPDGGAGGQVCLQSPISRGDASSVMRAVTVLRGFFASILALCRRPVHS